MPNWDESDDDYSTGPRGNRGIVWRVRTASTALIVLTAAAFLAQEIGKVAGYWWPMTVWLGLSREGVFGHGRAWQILTYAFLHADVWHILFNMLTLYWFGMEVEAHWGRGRFLFFYLTAAAFSGFLFLGLDQLVHPASTTYCIGASGAIMALLMVYAIYWPNRTVLFAFIFPMRMRTMIIILAVMQAFMLLDDTVGPGGKAITAHIGGLIYGYFYVRAIPLIGSLRYRLPALRLSSLSLHDAEADRLRMDELLGKIHTQGIQSLTWGEKRFLKRMSKRQ